MSRNIAAVFYAPDNHLEGFFVDAHGAFNVVWKVQNGRWHRPVSLTRPGFAKPGSPVAAVAWPEAAHGQMEVLLVDANGALTVIWKVGNANWQGPANLTGPRFAPSGAGIALVRYPHYDTLEAFVVDTRGVLTVTWKVGNNSWNAPVGLTDPGFVRPGAHVVAAYNPIEEQLEVFVAGSNGAVREIRKHHNNPWVVMPDVTQTWLVPDGAPLSTAYYPSFRQLFVFFVDGNGALRGVWRTGNGDWRGPFILTLPGHVQPGAAVAAVHYPPGDQVEVFVVGGNGVVNVAWRAAEGNWNAAGGLTLQGFASPGAPLAAAYYPLEERLELITTSKSDVLHVLWKVRNGWWVPCPLPLEAAQLDRRIERVFGRAAHVLGTVRVGQLTGTVDPENKPLLNNTGGWGVPGMDLGASTDHADGRFYIFFGDVVRGGRTSGPPHDADAVAWGEATKLGGHEHTGVNFVLPHDNTPIPGQRDWRFCVKCHGMFFDGYPQKGVCPVGGEHEAHPQSFNFVLPHNETGDRGPQDCRFCVKCHGLFLDGWPVDATGAPLPGVAPDRGVCPAGGRHEIDPESYRFLLPHDSTAVQGQADWRQCRRCRAVFFDGYQHKGLCPAGGKSFALNPVMNGNYFDPFAVEPPLGVSLTGETPTGSFSYGGRVYVFVVFWKKHDDAHPGGCYLVSKADPSQAGPYTEEFWFESPGFWQCAPTVVRNGEHLDLPSREGDGLIMFGYGGDYFVGGNAIHLAWMPLSQSERPQRSGIRYFTGDPAQMWSVTKEKAAPLFGPQPGYTSISAAWIPEAERWILLYSKASERDAPMGTIVARIGTSPWTWSEEMEVFNPCREQAFGRYMHWPFFDEIRKTDPPGLNHFEDKPGWAYGAFLLRRFLKWDPTTREMDLYYLLSLSSPYQVQLMFTKLRLP